MGHDVTLHKLTDSQRRQRADLKQRYALEPDSFQNKSGYTDGRLSDAMDLQRSQVQHGVPVIPFTASTPVVSVEGSRLFKAKSESDLSRLGTSQSVADVLGPQAVALQHPTKESISKAHETLTKLHYTFMGYHGTNKAGGNAMMAQGLHPGKIGSGGGTARGSGFYGAAYPNYAKDYADVATTDQESIKRYSGDSGIPQVMRVYLKDAGAMKHGRDFNWGIESSVSEPNFDRSVDAANSHNVPPEKEPRGIQANKRLMEMVVAPHRFDKMVVIPSVDPDEEQMRLGGVKWRPHEYHHTGLKD